MQVKVLESDGVGVWAYYNEDINQLLSRVVPHILYSMAYKPALAATFTFVPFDSVFEEASQYSSSLHFAYEGRLA